jgi:Glycosyltransferase family 17
MKIVDCFIFYNELKMLEFRLRYLYDCVDHFVIVEATRTHAGNPKPLFFEQNKGRFEKYMNKIVHIVVDDMPMPKKSRLTFLTQKEPNYPIIRENHQRICIDRGIQTLSLDASDLIIISDLDEIPDRNTLKTLEIGDGVYALLQDFYYYNFTCKNKQFWTQVRVLNFKTYKHYMNPHSIRMIQPEKSKQISRGGWHLSYFGDTEFIANKLKNFCHQEYNHSAYTDTKTIQDKIQKGIDLFGRTSEDFVKIPIEENDYLPDGYSF